MNNLSINPIKNEFSVFRFNDGLSYLDNAATTQIPTSIIDEMSEFMKLGSGSPHRGSHKLSLRATEIYDKSRRSVARFINAKDIRSIVFTSGTTESLNTIASSLTKEMAIGKTKILVFITSHHSNILPWQKLARDFDLLLEYIYLNDKFEIEEFEYDKINNDAFLVAFPLISNGIGMIHDTDKIVKRAKEHNVLTVADGAQALGHHQVDVENSSFDFFCFSSHKIYGPTGIGVLYGKVKLLEQMNPYKLGGDMIEYVTEESATFADLPEKFEAGTQNVEGAYGLLKAIEYIEDIGLESIIEYENELIDYAIKELSKIDDIKIIGGEFIERSSIVTFNLGEIHPHDVSYILDTYDVAIRAGHHCCQPLMSHLKLNSTCRLSVGLYSDKNDIDKAIEALKKVAEVFR